MIDPRLGLHRVAGSPGTGGRTAVPVDATGPRIIVGNEAMIV